MSNAPGTDDLEKKSWEKLEDGTKAKAETIGKVIYPIRTEKRFRRG